MMIMKTFVPKFKLLEKRLEKKISKKGLTITISGLSASGKTTEAKAIAKHFNLEYHSAGEIFREIARERGIPLEKFSKTRPEKIDLLIDKKTLELAIRGNVVLDGRLTGWVAGKWAKVRVWVDCPLYIRAKRMAQREGISVSKAKRLIKERDEADREKYLERYGVDILDKSVYNMIVKNSKWTLMEAKTKPVKVIRKLLNA